MVKLDIQIVKKLLNTDKVRVNEQIGRYAYDDSLPVTAVWDPGIWDVTAVWLLQRKGSEYLIVSYHYAEGKPFRYYLKGLEQLGYNYDRHYIPFQYVDLAIKAGLTGEIKGY